MPMRVQDGMQGGTTIIHGPDGFSYHNNREMKGGRLYIRCFRHHKTHCNGAASIDIRTEDGDFKRCKRHNHPPDRLLIHERRLRQGVLRRCRDPDDLTSLKDIYHDVRIDLRIPDDAAAEVPFDKIRPSMQAARAATRPNLPHSLTELANLLQDPQNQHFTETIDMRDSIFAGVVGQSAQRTRCVLFFSRRNLRTMRRVTKIFSDGTFVTPLNLGCSQIWMLATIRLNHVIPLGWVLMQSRLTEAYVAVLQALRRLVPGFRPTEIMCDFELAEQAAWEQVFPNAERHGCYFHICKDTCEMANGLGLNPFLRQNMEADSIVRSMCAIPLLETDLLLRGFDCVVRRADRAELEELAPLFGYFLRTWLTPGRLPILSVYGCENRTNNVCESHNRTLRSIVKVEHPNVFQLISAFARYEDIVRQDLNGFNVGNSGRNRRVSALANDRRIRTFTRDLEEGNISISRFLRNASQRIHNVYHGILR